MDWQAKINRLLAGRSASSLAKSVGLPRTAIRNAVNTGQVPRVDKALKIAKALGCTADWLFDESADWPPPDQPNASSLSDMELVEELARRRGLIRKDLAFLLQKLPRERLTELNGLAGNAGRTPKEQETLDTGLRDLIMAHSVGNKFSWLEPDHLFPPEGESDRPSALLFEFDHLREEFTKATHRIRHIADARYAVGIMGLRPPADGILLHPGYGDVIPVEDASCEPLVGQDRGIRFLPVIVDLSKAPPECLPSGFYPPDIADEVVHFASNDPNAFAYYVEDDGDNADGAERRIAVCEPGRDLSSETFCAVPSPSIPGTLRILKTAEVVGANPQYQSARIRREKLIKVFPVVAILPQPPPKKADN